MFNIETADNYDEQGKIESSDLAYWDMFKSQHRIVNQNVVFIYACYYMLNFRIDVINNDTTNKTLNYKEAFDRTDIMMFQFALDKLESNYPPMFPSVEYQALIDSIYSYLVSIYPDKIKSHLYCYKYDCDAIKSVISILGFDINQPLRIPYFYDYYGNFKYRDTTDLWSMMIEAQLNPDKRYNYPLIYTFALGILYGFCYYRTYHDYITSTKPLTNRSKKDFSFDEVLAKYINIVFAFESPYMVDISGRSYWSSSDYEFCHWIDTPYVDESEYHKSEKISRDGFIQKMYNIIRQAKLVWLYTPSEYRVQNEIYNNNTSYSYYMETRLDEMYDENGNPIGDWNIFFQNFVYSDLWFNTTPKVHSDMIPDIEEIP